MLIPKDCLQGRWSEPEQTVPHQSPAWELIGKVEAAPAWMSSHNLQPTWTEIVRAAGMANGG